MIHLSYLVVEPYYASNAGFEEIALAMGGLISAGKIRGWGLCNDNAYGLTACCHVAKQLGVPPPVSMQNDYSLIDRLFKIFICICIYVFVHR